MSADTAVGAPDLFEQLRTSLVPRGSAPLVRLFMRDAACFDADFVQKAVAEAKSRCALAAGGVDELSALEKLALHLLCDSAFIERPGT
jgi:hypothetical protein